MPIKKSAKYYLRYSKKKQVSNLAIKEKMREAIKETRELSSAGEKDKATESYKKTQIAIDQAVSRGVVKKQTASRYKSRLAAGLKRPVVKKENKPRAKSKTNKAAPKK